MDAKRCHKNSNSLSRSIFVLKNVRTWLLRKLGVVKIRNFRDFRKFDCFFGKIQFFATIRTMKIVSWNVNGVRAIEKKGELAGFLEKTAPDIFLLQEIKSQPENLRKIEERYGGEFLIFWHSAEKAGYSGTGIWVRRGAVENVRFSSGFPGFADSEGRVARVDFSRDGVDFAVFSVYAPNGGKSESAWAEKLEFYKKFLAEMNRTRESGREVIFGGDFNCAHEAIDLARPRENDGKIGFHPAERAEISKWISAGWRDVFRAKFPGKIVYSWWHVISRARERNVGWRIDYFFADRGFLDRIRGVEYLTEQMGSDHCPVELKF